MSDEAEVLRAAQRRAAALASGDTDRLERLLHADFRWTSHTGERFDRAAYVLRNTGGQVRWVAQELRSAGVVVVGETAVLHAEVSDTVDTGDGTTQTSVMPMTQVWVRDADGWRCLAGHAGPPRSPGS